MTVVTRFVEMTVLGTVVGVLVVAASGGTSAWGLAAGMVLGVVGGVQEATGLSMMRVVRRLPTH